MHNTQAPAWFAKHTKMANPCDPSSATITKIRSKWIKPSSHKTLGRHHVSWRVRSCQEE